MDNKSDIAKKEEEIMRFWQEHKVFELSESSENRKEDFVFYDGPPFATGTPHFGHLLPSSLKDIIPRYQTMKGKRVLRRWGWDCHGLPIENIIEKELNLGTKKDIEDYGIEKFNQKARQAVLRYTDEWKKTIPRIGRWVDMDQAYRTMDPSYSETVWWIFKSLYDQGLIYEGFKSMHLCPRCETTLSNFEVNLGYKDITDLAVTVKFELINEPNTYLLAWTTTPWTLPGNVALAVNEDFDYTKLKKGSEIYIVATEKVKEIFPDQDYTIIENIKGKTLVGKLYKPLFNYFVDESLVNFRNESIDSSTGWRVYSASYVTLEKGTGIVHLAPAFGEEDMELAKQENLPFIQHVDTGGLFKEAVTDFVGQNVKPKDDHQKTDILIIKYLAANNLLFSKEKINHSYPHCWRCQTPLINYAASSWFVKVTDLRDQLVELNKTINWVPGHVGEGRFGNWLEGARDWAISRQRFWGAPLPVWRCESCQEIKVFGSFNDLWKETFTPKTLTIMRHGEAMSNVNDFVSDLVDDVNPLSSEGVVRVKNQAREKLKDLGIDLIVHSPFLRTTQTAQLVAEELGLNVDQLVIDDRLGEINTGGYNGKSWAEYLAFFEQEQDRFDLSPESGETFRQVGKRIMSALFDIYQKYPNNRVLIVTHGLPSLLIQKLNQGKTFNELKYDVNFREGYLSPGDITEINFFPYPHNEDLELDVHRPYIDDIKPLCSCGERMSRINDVFDCWFESGSMPYAQAHYPFSDDQFFNPNNQKGFPADFIAEAIDQTRGWFYSLLVLGTGLFKQTPFKNVVVNGLILAEDGQKMSKSLKNYPDINLTIDRYGADALRLFLLGTPAVKADDSAFSEKGLSEVYRRVIVRLLNVLQFYEVYGDEASKKSATIEFNSQNILDRWIVSQLALLAKKVTEALDNYEIDKAVKPVDLFIDDLSTWYLRRSRDRFKEGVEATITTRFVLYKLSQIVAPLTPFIAEHLFQTVKTDNDQISVHLTSWPTGLDIDQLVIDQMTEVREITEKALALRAEHQIKIRQPLNSLVLKKTINDELVFILKEELNVKQVIFDETIEGILNYDFNITPELKTEGEVRDLVRNIQDLRKKQGYQPKDELVLVVEGDNNFINQAKDVLISSCGLTEVVVQSNPEGQLVEIGDNKFKLSLK